MIIRDDGVTKGGEKKKRKSGNVPFFHPGSRLSGQGMHGYLATGPILPGQAALWEGSQSSTGRGAAEGGGGGGGGSCDFFFFFLLNAKWLVTNPEAGLSCLKRAIYDKEDSPEVSGLCQITGLFLYVALKHVASNQAQAQSRLYIGSWNSLPFSVSSRFQKKPPHHVIPLFCCFLPGPIIKMTLLWPHSDVPLPPAGRTVNGIL